MFWIRSMIRIRSRIGINWNFKRICFSRKRFSKSAPLPKAFHWPSGLTPLRPWVTSRSVRGLRTTVRLLSLSIERRGWAVTRLGRTTALFSAVEAPRILPATQDVTVRRFQTMLWFMLGWPPLNPTLIYLKTHIDCKKTIMSCKEFCGSGYARIQNLLVFTNLPVYLDYYDLVSWIRFRHTG